MSPHAKNLEMTPELTRWYNNLKQGSEITADVYKRRVGAFCTALDTTPAKLAKQNPKKLYDLLLDYVASMEAKKKSDGTSYTGSYIQSTIKSVKSWLAFSDVPVTKKINIKGAGERPTLDNEIVPSQEELKRIFMAATGRDRVSCALIAHSGLRPETLGNYKGLDGLRISDFPELAIENDEVSFEVMPAKINVRPQLSKGRHAYFTFLSEEGCEYLKGYLEARMSAGEALTPDSDIIAPKSRTKHRAKVKAQGGRFITTINIGDGIRNAIRKAGLNNMRPYVLRAYFDTQLLIAESRGKITAQYRAFFMGHTGNMEARYTTNKRRLPDETIQEMREAYKRCQPFLQTVKAGVSEEDAQTTLRKSLLMVVGFTVDEISKLDLAGLEEVEVQRITREKLIGAMVNNGNKQKVVDTDDLGEYINQGWEFVAALPKGKAIIRLPH